MHRLADDVLAQHRPHRRQAVAAASERRRARTLQVDVAEPAVGVGELTQQQRAAVAQLRDVAAELVAGIRLGDGRCAVGNVVADQEAQSVGALQPGRIEAQLAGQRYVERQQPRVGKGLGLPTDGHLGQIAREAVLQSNGGIRCDAHPAQRTGGTGRHQRD